MTALHQFAPSGGGSRRLRSASGMPARQARRALKGAAVVAWGSRRAGCCISHRLRVETHHYSLDNADEGLPGRSVPPVRSLRHAQSMAARRTYVVIPEA